MPSYAQQKSLDMAKGDVNFSIGYMVSCIIAAIYAVETGDHDYALQNLHTGLDIYEAYKGK